MKKNINIILSILVVLVGGLLMANYFTQKRTSGDIYQEQFGEESLRDDVQRDETGQYAEDSAEFSTYTRIDEDAPIELYVKDDVLYVTGSGELSRSKFPIGSATDSYSFIMGTRPPYGSQEQGRQECVAYVRVENNVFTHGDCRMSGISEQISTDAGSFEVLKGDLVQVRLGDSFVARDKEEIYIDGRRGGNQPFTFKDSRGNVVPAKEIVFKQSEDEPGLFFFIANDSIYDGFGKLLTSSVGKIDSFEILYAVDNFHGGFSSVLIVNGLPYHRDVYTNDFMPVNKGKPIDVETFSVIPNDDGNDAYYSRTGFKDKNAVYIRKGGEVFVPADVASFRGVGVCLNFFIDDHKIYKRSYPSQGGADEFVVFDEVTHEEVYFVEEAYRNALANSVDMGEPRVEEIMKKFGGDDWRMTCFHAGP